MIFWTLQLVNGVAISMLLFLVSAGLSISLGLMRFMNVAHGSFYLIGSYVGLSLIAETRSFAFGLVGAGFVVGCLSAPMYRFLFQFYQGDELAQVLLGFGFLLIFGDVALILWGGAPQALPKPAALEGVVWIGRAVVPVYRLFITGAGGLIALGLWAFQERTQWGALLRAGVDDPEMASAVGVNVPGLFTAVFAGSAALAAVSGVLGGPIIGAYPGADLEILLRALAVIIIGGVGSLHGALAGSLLVGLVDTFGKVLFPQLATVAIFATMAAVLAVRPAGLFGRGRSRA